MDILLLYILIYVECRRAGVQRPEPLITSTLPELPWQKVGTDLFEWRKNAYLLVIDYFSRYIEIARLTADKVINHMTLPDTGYQRW